MIKKEFMLNNVYHKSINDLKNDVMDQFRQMKKENLATAMATSTSTIQKLQMQDTIPSPRNMPSDKSMVIYL